MMVEEPKKCGIQEVDRSERRGAVLDIARLEILRGVV